MIISLIIAKIKKSLISLFNKKTLCKKAIFALLKKKR